MATSSAYASDKRAWGICDVCGQRYRLKRLRDVFVRDHNTHLKACPVCWDEDHPQLFLGEASFNDPQALRDPRPDHQEYGQVRGRNIPVLFRRALSAEMGDVTGVRA